MNVAQGVTPLAKSCDVAGVSAEYEWARVMIAALPDSSLCLGRLLGIEDTHYHGNRASGARSLPSQKLPAVARCLPSHFPTVQPPETEGKGGGAPSPLPPDDNGP